MRRKEEGKDFLKCNEGQIYKRTGWQVGNNGQENWMARKPNGQETIGVRKGREGLCEECYHVPLALDTQVSPSKAELAARVAFLEERSQSETILG